MALGASSATKADEYQRQKTTTKTFILFSARWEGDEQKWKLKENRQLTMLEQSCFSTEKSPAGGGISSTCKMGGKGLGFV